MIEKSWNIKKEFPIKVEVKKSWTDKSYIIKVSPMKMKYETALKLGDNLTKDQIIYGKQNMNRKYDKNIEKYSNDVSICSYDYENGEVIFSSSTLDNITNWLMLYNYYVYSDNININ
jgi:hypothetical protein